MRLAFNATALLSPLTGIGQYSYALAAQLAAMPDVDAEYFYGAFWSKQLKAHSGAQSVAAALPWLRRHLPYSYELRRWLQSNRFRQHATRARFDVYHEPNILPLPFAGPTVVTVHDLSWIRYPQTHPKERVRAMNRYFEQGLQEASALITDAQSVKQELMETFGVASDRITAIPLGVDAAFAPQSPEQTLPILSAHQLWHGQYFLAVGTLEPRKNLQTALVAYQQLPLEIRNRFPLVLIGMKGWHTEALERQMAPLIQKGQLRKLGYVPQPQLASLLAGARTLVYPSIYEGFGLPPLEAMACGTPVICSNVSSLPEVVGDSGIMVHPRDDVGLMQTMRLMVEDEALWQALKAKSLVRAATFSWQNCAHQTVSVYKSVLK